MTKQCVYLDEDYGVLQSIPRHSCRSTPGCECVRRILHELRMIELYWVHYPASEKGEPQIVRLSMRSPGSCSTVISSGVSPSESRDSSNLPISIPPTSTCPWQPLESCRHQRKLPGSCLNPNRSSTVFLRHGQENLGRPNIWDRLDSEPEVKEDGDAEPSGLGEKAC